MSASTGDVRSGWPAWKDARHLERQAQATTGSCTFGDRVRPECLGAKAAYYKAYKQSINTNIKLEPFNRAVLFFIEPVTL